MSLQNQTKFLQYIQRYRSQRTADTYQVHLDQFLKMNFVEPYTIDDVEEFVDHLKSKGLQETSINSYLRTLRRYLNWCHDRLGTPKIKIEMLSANDPVHAVWTTEEMNRLEAELDYRSTSPRYKILQRTHYMLRYTAMRAGEVFHLQWDQIYPDFIWLKNQSSWNLKTRKEAKIPICEKLALFLEGEKRCSCGYLQLGNQNHFSELSHLTHSMKKFQREMQLDQPEPLKGYRSSVATELLSTSQNHVLVQNLLRHQHVATTQRYLNHTHLPLYDLVNQIGSNKGQIAQLVEQRTENQLKEIRDLLDQLLKK